MAQQQQELQDVKQQHASKLAELKSQQAGAEASATSLLQQAQARLSSTSALNGAELAAVRDKAAAAAEVEAAAEAAGKKAELLKAALQKVDDEVRLMAQNNSSSSGSVSLGLVELCGLPALQEAEDQRSFSLHAMHTTACTCTGS
jgi:membrane protein involved in colicin uptake